MKVYLDVDLATLTVGLGERGATVDGHEGENKFS